MNRIAVAVCVLSAALSFAAGWLCRPLLTEPPAVVEQSSGFEVRTQAAGWREVYVRTEHCPGGTWLRLHESTDSPVEKRITHPKTQAVLCIHADGTATLR